MEELQKSPWSEWEIVRLIGRGSFGAVYEVRREILGEIEKAAVKIISIPQNPEELDELYSDGYDDESITSTFNSHLKSIVAEYSLMQKMDGSSNVVNCKDVRWIQHDDGIGWDVYIRMELLTSLMKVLPAEVPEETVIKIGKDICNALVLCKKHEIVHRDIKPQNIFVSANGDYKLGDFGIAKTMERTMGGTKIGTYKYMAPEVYNNQPYGAAVDIYSLGLVMYWMLNRRRMPFMPLPPATMTMSLEEEARRRRLSGETLPLPIDGSDALKQIVMKACAYDPQARYHSAAEMLEDLKTLSDAGRGMHDSAHKPINLDEPTDEIGDPAELTDEISDPAEPTDEISNSVERTDEIEDPAEPVDEPISPEPLRVCLQVLQGKRYVLSEVSKTERIKAEGPMPGKTGGGLRPRTRKIDKNLYEETDKQPEPIVRSSKKVRLALVVTVGTIVLAAIICIACLPRCMLVGHQWQSATCTTPKSCLICGECEALPLGHTWTEANCYQPETCATCGETRGTEEHTYSDATCDMPMTCRLCAKTIGTPLEHIWKDATKDCPSTCERCGEQRGDVLRPAVSVRPYAWEGAKPVYSEYGGSVDLGCSTWGSFAASTVNLRVYNMNGDSVSLLCLSIAWKQHSVSIAPTELLPYGVYLVTMIHGDEYIDYLLAYGYADEAYLCQPTWFSTDSMTLRNSTNGRYLTESGGEYTTRDYSELEFAPDAVSVSGRNILTEDGWYLTVQEAGACFNVRTYMYTNWDYVAVLEYEGWYLASNNTGDVYLTKTLNENCYWIAG